MNKVEKAEAVEDAKGESEEKLLDILESKFAVAKRAQEEVRLRSDFPWDEREDLFFGKYKHPKEKTKSILSTGELSTIAIDGSCRVMAQLSTGRFYNYNGNTGSNMAMNLLFDHYVIPNATTGGHLLTKFRTVNMFSRVLPAIPVFIPWNVSDEDDGYTGPDMIIIHPRRFYPQPGKNAIEDMDYCFIDTEVSKEWLSTRDKSVWKNIDDVLKTYKDDKKDEGAGTPVEDRSPSDRNKTKTGITIRHQFLSDGSWRAYAPFEEGKSKLLINEKEYYPCIPIALKGQYPVIDSVWHFNDFDRGQMTQKSIDSVVRMNLDAYGIAIKPPVLVDPKKLSMASVVMGAGEIWVGEIGSAQVQNINPNALNTFQATYGMLKGNLLSLGAQQDTSVPISVDAGMGKTPEAIRAQGSKQGARDAWDSFMQERFVERVYTIMADMIAKKGITDFTFNLFGNSLKKIQEQYPAEDLKKFLSGDKMTIGVDSIKGKYRHEIEPGSIGLKKDDTGQKLLSFIDLFNKYPGIANDFKLANQKFNQGEAFKRALIDSGVQDSEKIIVTQENPASVSGVGPDGATVHPQIDPTTGQPIPSQPTDEIEQMKQAIDQLGQAVKQLMSQPVNHVKSPSESITSNYKDFPEDVKREFEASVGLTPSQIGSAVPPASTTVPLNQSVTPTLYGN